MRKKYERTIGLATLPLVEMLSLTYEHILLAIGNFLVVKDNLHHADIIHVIAGKDHRADYAIEQYKQGYGGRLFFTGGWCDTHNEYHSERGKNLALHAGLLSYAVANDNSKVTSTYSEAQRLKSYIYRDKSFVRSVMIVSDPYHMRRARWVYQQVLGPSVIVHMAPVPFEISPYKHKWWKDHESRNFVLREYIKNIYYIVRYKYSWGALRKWLESLNKG
jgi:uncharacterized SAM-binding protein YcdF (DUF218 family)